MIHEYIEKLRPFVLEYFKHDSTGHDIGHLERTLNTALYLCDKEGGDKVIVGISAFLHDVHRIMQTKEDKFIEPIDSLPVVRSILSNIDLTEEQVEKICYCIEHHEKYNWNGDNMSDINALILQDADNLDATGAIAIVRAFRYGLANKMPDYDPQVPFYQNDYTESVNDKSTVHHLYNKSLRIGDYMHTETARQIAKEKMALIKDFIDLYVKEFNCDF